MSFTFFISTDLRASTPLLTALDTLITSLGGQLTYTGGEVPLKWWQRALLSCTTGAKGLAEFELEVTALERAQVIEALDRAPLKKEVNCKFIWIDDLFEEPLLTLAWEEQGDSMQEESPQREASERD